MCDRALSKGAQHPGAASYSRIISTEDTMSMSPLVSSYLLLLLVTCVLAAPVFDTISQAEDETDASLNYKFGFQVRDPHNYNFQERHETRDKGVISGYYSLLEPDGSLRVVTYTADHDGFRALVARQGSDSGQAISATAHN